MASLRSCFPFGKLIFSTLGGEGALCVPEPFGPVIL